MDDDIFNTITNDVPKTQPVVNQIKTNPIVSNDDPFGLLNLSVGTPQPVTQPTNIGGFDMNLLGFGPSPPISQPQSNNQFGGSNLLGGEFLGFGGSTNQQTTAQNSGFGLNNNQQNQGFNWGNQQ